MFFQKRCDTRIRLAAGFVILFVAASCQSNKISPKVDVQNTTPAEETPASPKTVKGMMQARPGGPLEEVEVAVHEAPVNVSSVRASQAEFSEHDLVLGVVLDGQAMAYPIRYLAMYEIVDDEVAHSPIAATW